MVTQTGLVNELQSILGVGSVLPPKRTAEFGVEGMMPQAVVAPSTVEQVAEVMRYAHREGLAVIPWGGGTLMHLGNLPQRYDIAVSLSRLDQVIEHEPADLTVTCQAGITLGELQRRLAGAGQFLPLDPPYGETTTIGGILAANASGPSRHAYGTARDFTIGMRVVNADGRLTKTGGRVVKNVAGYDLCKLYIGSLGTLGVIVEATFKLSPLPKAERTLALGFPAPADACAFAAEVHRRGLALRALDLLNAAACHRIGLRSTHPYSLLLWLAATPPALQRSHDEITMIAATAPAPLTHLPVTEEVWERVRRLASAEVALLCKASCLPDRLPELLSAAEAVSAPALLARPTSGVMYASWPAIDNAEAAISRLRVAVSAFGGALVVEACAPNLKRRLDVFGHPPPSFALMGRVKEQLDPQGVLSPGRFLGRL